MATKKTVAKTSTTKKAPAKKAVAKTSTTKKAPAKKTVAKTSTTKKAPAKKAVAKTSTTKKAPTKNASTKKSPTEKVTAKKVVATSTNVPQGSSMVGKKAPSFSLQDQSGKEISSASLKGKPYVLYFYPKDNTPGCTKESCDFRDAQRNFRAAGVTILGVSPDSVKSHAGFAEKYELPFSLLSDPEKELANAYGVWALKKNYGREYFGIVRSTFLVDKSGKVVSEWRQVKVNGHSEVVLAEAKK